MIKFVEFICQQSKIFVNNVTELDNLKDTYAFDDIKNLLVQSIKTDYPDLSEIIKSMADLND
jgi:hypothetical protein